MAKQREFVDDAPVDESQEIIVRGESSIVPVGTRRDAMGLIELAIERGYAVADLKSLAELQERQDERRAREAYNAALVNFKRDAPVVVKRRGVSLTGGARSYSYAAIEDIEDAIGPSLLRHGFAYSFPSSITGEREGWMRTTCRITHAGGHAEETTIDLPIPSEMRVNATQKGGAAISYGRRYALCSSLGLRIVGEDDDGQSLHATSDAVDRMITPVTIEQANTIQAMLRQLPGDTPKFLSWVSQQAKREVKDIIDIPQSCYTRAVEVLKNKIAGAK